MGNFVYRERGARGVLYTGSLVNDSVTVTVKQERRRVYAQDGVVLERRCKIRPEFPPL